MKCLCLGVFPNIERILQRLASSRSPNRCIVVKEQQNKSIRSVRAVSVFLAYICELLRFYTLNKPQKTNLRTVTHGRDVRERMKTENFLAVLSNSRFCAFTYPLTKPLSCFRFSNTVLHIFAQL